MTKIEWTNESWNPIIGCDKISPGCKECYAEKMAGRLSNIGSTSYYINVVKHEMQSDNPNFIEKGLPKWNGKTHFVKSALTKPLHWAKPQMIFVCSMGDLFHESVDIFTVAKIFAIMFLAKQHTFQVLTKRPERAKMYLRDKAFLDIYWKYCNQLHNEFIKPLESELYNFSELMHEWPLSNVWFGTSTENQEQAEKRIPILLQIPAAIRFVSCEPLLGPIDLGDIAYNDIGGESHINSLYCDIPNEDDEQFNGATLDWVIAGGESGPKAKPMHPNWIYSLLDQCTASKTPFFFKQWGEWKDGSNYPKKNNIIVLNNGEYSNWDNDEWKKLSKKYSSDQWNKLDAKVMSRVGKKKAGCLLDEKEYKQFPNQ